MEGITLFVSIVIIVFGILQIILFFKLWGMTNDVKKLVNYFCNEPIKSTNRQITSSNPEIEYDKNLDNIKANDHVIRISDGKEMVVDSIENGKFFCIANSLEGYKWYSKNEIKST